MQINIWHQFINHVFDIYGSCCPLLLNYNICPRFWRHHRPVSNDVIYKIKSCTLPSIVYEITAIITNMNKMNFNLLERFKRPLIRW